MGEVRGVRIVKHGPRRRAVDVFDLETGEKLLNVHAVELVVDPARSPMTLVRITADIPFEYEGPATFVASGEAEE